VSAGSGAGADCTFCGEPDAAAAGGAWAGGTVLVLLVHPVSNAEARTARAAIARQRLGEAFMGGAPLNRKVTPNMQPAMHHFGGRRPEA